MDQEGAIEGVIGVIFDVTELRAREMDLIEQAKERRQLVANEAAAKEASRLKSQFLANVRQDFMPAPFLPSARDMLEMV